MTTHPTRQRNAAIRFKTGVSCLLIGVEYHVGSYLDQEPQVNILTFGLLPVNLTVLVVSDVNSLGDSTKYVNYTPIQSTVSQKC